VDIDSHSIISPIRVKADKGNYKIENIVIAISSIVLNSIRRRVVNFLTRHYDQWLLPVAKKVYVLSLRKRKSLVSKLQNCERIKGAMDVWHKFVAGKREKVSKIP